MVRTAADLSSPIRVGPFVPWGHNYGPKGKLLEDIWEADWDTVANDFREMRRRPRTLSAFICSLGSLWKRLIGRMAVRLHNWKNCWDLAEDVGIYLDITGLACYRTSDVPAWYDWRSARKTGGRRRRASGRLSLRSGPRARRYSATT